MFRIHETCQCDKGPMHAEIDENDFYGDNYEYLSPSAIDHYNRIATICQRCGTGIKTKWEFKPLEALLITNVIIGIVVILVLVS